MADGSGHTRVGSHASHPTRWGSTGVRVGPVAPQRRRLHQRGELVLVAGDPGGRVQSNLVAAASSTPPATAVCTIQRPRAECVGMTASGATSSSPICGSWGFVSGRRGPSASHLCYTTPGAGSVGPPTRPPRAVVQYLGARTPSASLPTRAATPAMALGEGRARVDSYGGNNACLDALTGRATMVEALGPDCHRSSRGDASGILSWSQTPSESSAAGHGRQGVATPATSAGNLRRLLCARGAPYHPGRAVHPRSRRCCGLSGPGCRPVSCEMQVGHGYSRASCPDAGTTNHRMVSVVQELR